MNKIRVYELAKEYGLTNEQMMNFLLNNNIDVSSHMSIVNLNEIGSIVKQLDLKTNFEEHTNKTLFRGLKIEGLFGKYNYNLKFNNDICIWVSENGKGKTTILNIIVALLTGDKKTLIETNFRRLEVEIGNKIYSIDKTKLNKRALDDKYVNRFFDELREIMPFQQYKRILNEYRRDGNINFEYLERYLHHYMHDEYSYRMNFKQLYHIFQRIREEQFDNFADNLYEIKNALQEEPLFYPTYRRIEVPANKIFENKALYESSNLKYMYFGMEDVKQRIQKLLEKMSNDAIDSYAEMNGEIINELLTGATITELTNDIPNIDKHKVEVVIKRIGEKRIESVDKLNLFVKENQYNPNEAFLKFYLDKLVKIYDSQKAIDDKLTRFANVCTKYLSGKKVVYDEALLSVVVYDENEMPIDFDDLSSGEKQVISIFSKVYLDVTTSCIFVIDEPELSLSIEWQKDFLNDIYNSGKVSLLIATTHSPFIFKNSFREYTVDMDMYKEEI